MNDTQVRYKGVMLKIGAIMLIFVGLLEVLMSGYGVITAVAYEVTDDVVALDVISSILYDAAYLASFMLPAAFALLLFRKKERQPMRFQPKASLDTFAFVFVVVTCIYAFSYINSYAVSAIIGDYTVDDIFYYAPEYTSDYGVVLNFITIALVPAFCEEFLFRGVVLSHLMPYGKSTAIVVSSICFGLMHSNFQQFLYTTVAGILLGLVYVITDSIWPSTIIHMLNNAITILQAVIFERMAYDYAVIAWMIVNCVIFTLGIISGVYLIIKYKRGNVNNELDEGYVSRDALICGAAELPAESAAKGFFSVTMIIFVCYSIFGAVMRLFVV